MFFSSGQNASGPLCRHLTDGGEIQKALISVVHNNINSYQYYWSLTPGV